MAKHIVGDDMSSLQDSPLASSDVEVMSGDDSIVSGAAVIDEIFDAPLPAVEALKAALVLES